MQKFILFYFKVTPYFLFVQCYTFSSMKFYDMKCMLMIPNVFKNTFSSIKSIFIKIQKLSPQKFPPKPKKSIKHFKKNNFGWPHKLTHNHMYSV